MQINIVMSHKFILEYENLYYIKKSYNNLSIPINIIFKVSHRYYLKVYRLIKKFINMFGMLFAMVEGYCVKCKKKVEIKDATTVTMKNNKPAIQGVCPVCSTKIYRIGKAS